jgi:hypothetical protein
MTAPDDKITAAMRLGPLHVAQAQSSARSA